MKVGKKCRGEEDSALHYKLPGVGEARAEETGVYNTVCELLNRAVCGGSCQHDAFRTFGPGWAHMSSSFLAVLCLKN